MNKDMHARLLDLLGDEQLVQQVDEAYQEAGGHVHKFVILVESIIERGHDGYQSMATGTYFPGASDTIRVTKLRCECGEEIER